MRLAGADGRPGDGSLLSALRPAFPSAASAALAGLLTTIGQLAGWHGVDVAAAVYRANAFRHHGFTLWDPGWYGGHWTLDYSVLYPPVAGTFGPAVTVVASAVVAAYCFDRLLRPATLARGSTVASLAFAVGTLVPASIGQYPFLAGAAAGLVCLVALRRQISDRRLLWLAVAAALVCSLFSPLPAAFLVLAVVAGAAELRRHRSGLFTGALVIFAALVPVAVTGILFPGEGTMPYPALDWFWEVVVASIVAGVAGRRWRVVRRGALLLAAATTLSFAVPSPVGGNVGRLEDLAALPLVLGMGWARLASFDVGAWWRLRHTGLLRHGRLWLAVTTLALAVPIAMSEWQPAWAAMASSPAEAARSFYVPLDRALRAAGATSAPTRVEVVPTAYHGEAAWVAPVVSLARGWERQLDVADNPIFYRPGPISPGTYRNWLSDNGVSFVALANAPLDSAGVSEAQLIRSGHATFLHPIWRSKDWTLYSVAGGDSMVSGPASLDLLAGGGAVVDFARPATVLVRERWTPAWHVTSGAGAVAEAPGGWLAVTAPWGGRVSLAVVAG